MVLSWAKKSASDRLARTFSCCCREWRVGDETAREARRVAVKAVGHNMMDSMRAEESIVARKEKESAT